MQPGGGCGCRVIALLSEYGHSQKDTLRGPSTCKKRLYSAAVKEVNDGKRFK